MKWPMLVNVLRLGARPLAAALLGALATAGVLSQPAADAAALLVDLLVKLSGS